PNRLGSSLPVSRPASSTASAAAPTAKRTARLISLAFLRCSPRYGPTSKFLTSPAILIGRPVVSKLSMELTPDLPSIIDSLNARRPIPLGATTPMPVITTRCMVPIPQRLRALKDSQDCLPGHFILPPMSPSGKGNRRDGKMGRLNSKINEKYAGGKAGDLFL